MYTRKVPGLLDVVTAFKGHLSGLTRYLRPGLDGDILKREVDQDGQVIIFLENTTSLKAGVTNTGCGVAAYAQRPIIVNEIHRKGL